MGKRGNPMANHKRKRPKNRRGGCLLCKPWKMNGYGKERVDAAPFSSVKRKYFAKQDLKEYQVYR